ncbi:hypothetical protein TPA0910_47690 [Streptomyces hygroscopicus subsp. sporocinereus]|uniref:Uncharacterized protein n=1 Tax=Streptomyces hygroscopicus TaxID=1912 RepID=A0ABQ3U4Z8_STRHY|nr:hypothetical protein TPA0910_47690 [Streptomyces hygroscopicus]
MAASVREGEARRRTAGLRTHCDAASHSTPQGVPLPKTFDKVVASDQVFSEGVPHRAAPRIGIGPRARWPSRHGPAPARQPATRPAPRPRPPLLNRAKRARRYPHLTSGWRSEGAVEAAILHGPYENAKGGGAGAEHRVGLVTFA